MKQHWKIHGDGIKSFSDIKFVEYMLMHNEQPYFIAYMANVKELWKIFTRVWTDRKVIEVRGLIEILLDSSGNNQVLAEKIDKDEKRCYRRNKRLENQKGLKERTRNNN